MRELKFRAWDRIDKRMITIERFSQIPSNWRDVMDLMQFTGLHDKNGKEIYEGDVLRFIIDDEVYRTQPVEWKPEFGLFYAGINVGEYCPEDMWACEDVYEVIGNIYENPELLEPTP